MATPDPPDDQHACALWAHPSQVDLAQEALREAKRSCTLVGTPRQTDAPALGRALDCPHAESFRDLLRSSAPCVLALAPPPRADGEIHGAALHEMRERGARLLTLEPFPSSVRDAVAVMHAELGATVLPAPLLRRSPGGRAALDALETFGPVRVVAVSGLCAAGQGTLASRLVDAMDWILSVLGEPETIDACAHGPRSAAGLMLAPGDSLATLTGDMTAHLRFSTGASATMTLSDRSGRWFRGATLHGDAGVLRVVDRGLEWLDERGGTTDRTGADAEESSAACALAQALREAMDEHAKRDRPFDFLRTLAMAEAAVLSARTGQAESPATVLRMAGAA